MGSGKVARLAADATVEELKQAVIHDVNNALTGIYGGLDLADSTVSRLAIPRLSEDLSQIREAADRLLTITREIARPAPGAPQPLRCSGRRRLLVVEDDPGVLELIGLALSPGTEVVGVPTAGEALALLLGEGPFDALLTDLSLPDLDAPRLTTAVRTLCPLLIGRIVVMTGGADKQGHQTFLSDWDGPILYKPFSIAALRDLVLLVSGGFDSRAG